MARQTFRFRHSPWRRKPPGLTNRNKAAILVAKRNRKMGKKTARNEDVRLLSRALAAGLALALSVENNLHHTAIMHSQNVSRLNRAAKVMQTSIFVKNGPSYAGLGIGAEGFTTYTIATPTGEGTTSARTFARKRRCVLTNGFSIR